MNDESKQIVSRKQFAGIYVLTYLVALLCVAPAVFDGLEDIVVKRWVFLLASLFPFGLFSLFVGVPESSLIPLVVVGYLIYAALCVSGIARRNWKLYAVFVFLLILNVAGCHHGLSQSWQISPV